MIKNLSKSYKELETLDYSGISSLEDLTKVVGMPKVVTEKVDGRLVQRVVFEETPVEKLNEGLTVDDFALENLIANGYTPERVDISFNHLSEIDKTTKSAEKLAKANVKVKQSTKES